MKMQNNKGVLVVISAPSGCGKGTVIKELREICEIYYSVSMTTRKPRDEDIPGVTYFFTDREGFLETVKNGGMLEYAEYVGNFYGTPKAPIIEKLSEGKNVILEIEVKGAMQVKKLMPEALLVFIMPPSEEELERRLISRGTDDEETVRQRMETAKTEMASANEYDAIIINDDVKRAARELADNIINRKEMNNTPAQTAAETENINA
jgi:guanylate kinase